MQRIRDRAQPPHTPGGATLTCTVKRYWPVYSETVLPCAPVFTGFDGYFTEQCIDQTNPKRFGKYMKGGELEIMRHEVRPTTCDIDASFGDASKWTEVKGVTYPCFYGAPAAGLPQTALPASGMDATRAYGAEAWNKYKPGKPKVQAAVFLAELRDLPGMLKKQAYAHRNLGKHYLSAQFGWLPFVSDIRKMLQTQKRMGQIIENIRHLNGKWTKRSGTVKDAVSGVVNWEHAGASIPCFDPMIPWDAATFFRCQGHSSTHVKVWFSGRFRYYIEDLDRKVKDPKWNANLERKIMGGTITPADVWEAIPWSWLIDYFTNAGDIISNLSNGVVDDVVARYAYVMRSQVQTCIQSSEATLRNGSTVRGIIERTIETKSRAVADPYGFGVTAELSGRQLAILAALGISRM